MKKVLFIILSVLFFSMQAISQDPYIKLKQKAAESATLKEDLTKVTIAESDRRLIWTKKATIPFKPFEMVDKNGKKIDPNETITVNGRNEKAKVFFDKLNEIEKNQNTKGYSLRDSKSPLVIKVITPNAELGGRVSQMSKRVGQLKEESELGAIFSTTKKVGTLMLKPYETYSGAEKNKLNQTRFSVDASGQLRTTFIPRRYTSYNPSKTPSKTTAGQAGKRGQTFGHVKNRNEISVDGSYHPAGEITPLKVIGDISSKEWSLGIMSTFKAGVKADLLRSAKIYSFNPQSPGKSMSEFKIRASANVYAGLFGHSMDLLSGGMEFFAPADSSKKMTAKGQILIAGLTVLNLNESITQSKSYNKTTGMSVDKSFPITIPICCGVDFAGKIGIKGNVGLNYSGAIYRTIVNLQAEPVIDIKGYAEAGLSVGGIAKFGIGGELTFLKGHIPLNGLVGIWAQNAEQIVVGYNYYMGFDLSVLSGRLYGYADICAPLFGCYRIGEVDFFTWGGFKGSGTFVEGGNYYVLANL
ncbi:MAG: hypothetical protein KF825_10605 [Ferruginibacter sp.]|nr:hypothetical protein [Ferruginibacter sp.]